MANKKVLATSSGLYAVKDGKTIHLPKGEEATIDAEQAEKLAKRGKVTFVTNAKQSAKAE